jgi:hypothetical protein
MPGGLWQGFLLTHGSLDSTFFDDWLLEAHLS